MINSPHRPIKRLPLTVILALTVAAVHAGCAARNAASTLPAAPLPAAPAKAGAGEAVLPCPPAPAPPPAAPSQMLQDGMTSYDAGRYAEALRSFEAIDADGHADGMILYRLAFCYGAGGDEDKGHAAYERARDTLQARETSGAATLEERFYLVNVLLNLKLAPEAKATADRAIQGMESCAVPVPPGGSSSFRAGKLYGDAGNRERQAAWYRRALKEFETEPAAPAAYVQRAGAAVASWDIGRTGWAQSLPQLQQARQASPGDPEVVVSLLVAQLHAGDIAGAEASLVDLRPIAGRHLDELAYLKGITRTVKRMAASGTPLPEKEPDGTFYPDFPTDQLAGAEEDHDGTRQVRPGLLQTLAVEGNNLLTAPFQEGDGVRQAPGPKGVALLVPAPETLRRIDALQGRFVSTCLEIVRRGLPLQEIAFTSSVAPLIVHDWRGQWIQIHRPKAEGAAEPGPDSAAAPPPGK